ncbi:MAG: hemolysin family protein [Treponema sp.]|nr:hemolysin family protein [Treponema sp.]
MSTQSFARSFFKKGGTEIDKKTYESLETDRQEMIQGVVELSETTAKEVMVPRIDTVFLPSGAGREDLLGRIIESGHSRFPVYEETIDQVIGILHVKDILRNMVLDEPFDLAKLLRKPFFVPESKHIDELLRELRRRRVHIAVVVDEYGGVSGIVCLEDILEEIIGDIQDEFDNEKEDILDSGEGAWIADPRINMEDLAEHIGVSLPSDDFDTLGGFVFDLFGKIPSKSEKAVWQDLEFIIQEMDGRKINSIKIIRNNHEKKGNHE